jgi:hypothetical protein
MTVVVFNRNKEGDSTPPGKNEIDRALERFLVRMGAMGGMVSSDVEERFEQALHAWQDDQGELPSIPEPRACLFQEAFRDIESISKESLEKLRSRLREEFTASSVRAHYRERPMLTCYGRVGTGKSILGTFVGLRLGARFFEVTGGDRMSIERFVSGPRPVSDIRLFEHSALVWVDAPGRFSQNEKDDLDATEARRWADLVLFLTPFDQVFVEHEVDDLASLIGGYRDQGVSPPPIVVGLSRADKVDYRHRRLHKEIRHVARAADDIQEVQAYVDKVLEERGLSQDVVRVIPFSSFLAEAGDSASGAPELLECFAEIYEGARAQLKNQQARGRLKGLLASCRKLVSEQRVAVGEISVEAQRAAEAARQELDGLQRTVEEEVHTAGLAVLDKAKEKGQQVSSPGDVEEIERWARKELRLRAWRGIAGHLEAFAKKYFQGLQMQFEQISSSLEATRLVQPGSITVDGGKKGGSDRIARGKITSKSREEVARIATKAASHARGEMANMLDELESSLTKYARAWSEFLAEREDSLTGLLDEVSRSEPRS